MIDFSFQDEGSIVILYPLSARARDWMTTFISISNEVQYWGDGTVIERRYFWDILVGITDAGMSVTEAAKI